ncbi:MAG: F0F1 ATP synthase subunit B [Limnochordia bacterium]|jgi:F-type H+-transporting ATPase subunit b
MMFGVVLAAAADHAGTSNPLSIDLWTLLLQSLNVLVVMAVLYFLLFRPLGALMAKREKEVADSLSQAEQTRGEAEKLLAEYQERMRNAQAEAEAIIAEATKKAEQYATKRKAEADAQYEEIIRKAKAEIDAERARAMAAMREEVAQLAVMAAGQVLGRTISAADHRKLIEEFVQKVGGADDVSS